jgi:stage II sporulation protein D
VNGEFSSKWNTDAIAAQVIAARSYALYQLKNARMDKKVLFDVDSTTRDQVYLGIEGEEPRATQIVSKTRGLILTAAEGSDRVPIKAFYHSTCAGLTGSPIEVWGKAQAGVKGGVHCFHCGSSPRFRWKLQLSKQELEKILASYVFGSLLRIEPVSYFDSGRVKDLQIISESQDGQEKTVRIPSAQFRFLLGSNRLKSTFFSVSEPFSGEWQFDGRGYGHGVGMCQWGAKEMGAAGYSFQEILGRYYPLARIVRAWP